MMKWILLALGLGVLNYTGDIKVIAFRKGLQTSRYFQKYPGWNRFVEPFIIRQFGLVFGASNAFLQGMLSDNKNSKKDQEKLKDIIERQLKD